MGLWKISDGCEVVGKTGGVGNYGRKVVLLLPAVVYYHP